MILKPILIIGAPRSGTSLLQKILRDHPSIWSLPSESDLIWDKFCHPALRNWESETCKAEDANPEIRKEIISLFERYLGPSILWKPMEKANIIWSFRRNNRLRRVLKPVYQKVFPLGLSVIGRKRGKRIVEKTASNCFRLGFVNEIFPDARIIYPTRDGRSNINSLINGWRNPSRFFTYDVPERLKIKGYFYRKWNFVLPSGWRNYTNSRLEDVCAFQWCSCHQAMIKEIRKKKYENRVFRIKLEDLVADPDHWLKMIADFVEMPYDGYFRSVADNLPIVNSPDNDTDPQKWKRQNPREIERIWPKIQKTMEAIGY